MLKFFKLLLLGLVLISFCNRLHAQQLIFKSEIDNKKLGNMGGVKEEDYIFVNGEIEILVNGEQASRNIIYAIQPNKDSIRSFPLKRFGINIIGQVSTPNEVHIYFISSETADPAKVPKAECLTFSKLLKTFTRVTPVSQFDIEASISSFSAANRFVTFHVNKKDKKLVLSIYQEANVIETKEFVVQNELLFNFIKKNKFKFIPDIKEVSFDDALSQNKIYYYDNKFIWIINNWGRDKEELQMIEIDPASNALIEKKIKLPYKDLLNNSFLSGGRLFVLGINHQLLNLSIYELSSGQQIKEYQYLAGEPILFKASPWMKNKAQLNKISKTVYNNKEAAKMIRYEFDAGVPAITVSHVNDHTMRLTLGSYSRPYGENTIAYPIGGVTATDLMFGSAIAGMTVSMLEEIIHRVSFDAYLNSNDFSIASQPVPQSSKFIQIEMRKAELEERINLSGEGIINAKDKTYFIYIDKKNKTLNIEEF